MTDTYDLAENAAQIALCCQDPTPHQWPNRADHLAAITNAALTLTQLSPSWDGEHLGVCEAIAQLIDSGQSPSHAQIQSILTTLNLTPDQASESITAKVKAHHGDRPANLRSIADTLTKLFQGKESIHTHRILGYAEQLRIIAAEWPTTPSLGDEGLSSERKAALIEAAQSLYAEGSNDDIELDDPPYVRFSQADNGTWVSMWGWVNHGELKD